MKVSITLPTLYPELAETAVRNILYNTVNVDYEILVISPNKIETPNTVWVKEDVPRGNCAAHNLGFEQATGDIVIALTDDYLVGPFWLNSVLRFFLQREAHHGYKPYVCGIQSADCAGTVMGMYYPYFPVARRQVMKELGGWYRPIYAAHFGDPDIGMRIWNAGGHSELCYSTKLFSINRRNTPESQHKIDCLSIDAKTFVNEWSAKYGLGWDLTRIRNFNVDMQYALLHWLPDIIKVDLIDNYTINYNKSEIYTWYRNALIQAGGLKASEDYFNQYNEVDIHL